MDNGFSWRFNVLQPDTDLIYLFDLLTVNEGGGGRGVLVFIYAVSYAASL